MPISQSIDATWARKHARHRQGRRITRSNVRKLRRLFRNEASRLRERCVTNAKTARLAQSKLVSAGQTETADSCSFVTAVATPPQPLSRFDRGWNLPSRMLRREPNSRIRERAKFENPLKLYWSTIHSSPQMNATSCFDFQVGATRRLLNFFEAVLSILRNVISNVDANPKGWLAGFSHS
jgi:hypothetical protein